MKLSDLRKVKEAKDNGVWINVSNLAPELKIKYRYMTNPFKESLRKMFEEIKDQKLSVEDTEIKIIDLLCDNVVCDYEGVLDDNDNAIAFDKETAREILKTFSSSADSIFNKCLSDDAFIQDVLGK